MASKSKRGKYGITKPRVDNIMGTVIVHGGQFDNIKGEIINYRDDYLQYLTVQVPSEYNGRVYILNLMYKQCRNIEWR